MGVSALILLTLVTAGCDSSDDSPAPTPTSGPTAGSIFVPVAPPLSPDTARGSAAARAGAASGGSKTGAAVAGASNGPVLDHWFYLVNGEGLPTPPPGSSSAPPPSITPNVLTVSGLPPGGAPNPNGGTEVSLLPLNADASGTQLFKAIGVGAGVYLRSAESFESNPSSASALIAYNAGYLHLDVGHIPNWTAVSVYMNPQGFVSTSFLQWLYDTGTAQLTNVSADGQLVSTTGSSELSVSDDSSAPQNQWYAYPNYFLEQVLADPNSDPPFPAWTTSGQNAAYDYVSDLLGVENVDCTYEGTAYTGIRCEYEIVSTSEALSNCVTEIALAGENPPTSFGGVAISSSDWSVVSAQLESECSYAVGVQSTFNYFDQVLTEIFVNDADQIDQLAADVGASSSDGLNPVPIDILEGITYTVLCATGETAAGVFANLMSAAVNTALSASGETLSHPLATTVGNLYGDLGTSFEQVSIGLATAENSILTDWGRLQQIGPATNVVGYNGLGLTAGDVDTIESAALNGYELTVMQQLAPLEYQLGYSVATTSSTPFTNQCGSGSAPPGYDNLSYSTFGATGGSYNGGFLYYESGLTTCFDYPSSTVLQTDILDNGADPFEVFTGVNGWSGLKIIPQNYECNATFVGLFNYSPNDLEVTVTVESDGWVASPGTFYSSSPAGGSGLGSGSYTAELRPFGYVPIYGATGADSGKTDLQISITNDGAFVASFEFEQDGCDTPSVSDQNTATGYGLGVLPESGSPPGVSATLFATE